MSRPLVSLAHLLLWREATALANRMRSRDVSQRRALLLNGGAFIVLASILAFVAPELGNVARAQPPTIYPTFLLAVQLAVWVSASLAGMRTARAWTAGADIPWRIAGISSWERAILTSLGWASYGLLGMGLMWPLGYLVRVSTATLWASLLWLAAMGALSGGWTAAAERQSGDRRLQLHLFNLFALALVASGANTLFNRGALWAVALLAVAACGLAVFLWRIAVVSDVADHASAAITAALRLASAGVAPPAITLDIDRSRWTLVAALLSREITTISRLPFVLLAQVVGGALLTLVGVGIVAGVREPVPLSTSPRVAAVVGALMIGFYGLALVQTRVVEPTRAWWGWVRLRVPSIHLLIGGYAGFVLLILAVVLIPSTLLYAVLSWRLDHAAAFAFGGFSVAIAVAGLTSAAVVLAAALNVETQLAGRLFLIFAGIAGVGGTAGPLALSNQWVGLLVSGCASLVCGIGGVLLMRHTLVVGDFAPTPSDPAVTHL